MYNFIINLCPSCNSIGHLRKHSKYIKYFYSAQLLILRVKCDICSITHAIMPSFSLPGTSIGTEDAENYFLMRRHGISRQTAAESLLISGIRSIDYPKHLDKLLEKTVNRAKAIFTDKGNHSLNGLDWIESIIGQSKDLILDFNKYCLSNNVNVIFFIRFNAIIFKKNKSKMIFSHNIDSETLWNKSIDSG